ncbi:uncharacterized protein LOC130736741 [Lotus japonicus]|uniref:uncharacterized protein LOC130736741 n=1 Tax=Lotus japonicus TaxID=34305 RepID=UPI0025900980|nr:uncharacterized protein LOC130736741 [Lotus japonicus]
MEHNIYMYKIVIHLSKPDKEEKTTKLIWVKESDGIFSVKSAYDSIVETDLEFDESNFNLVWKVWAPSNASALGWRVFLDRIQTKMNLVRRNIPISSCACPWCGIAEETTSHLLFVCPFAWCVWSLILRWLGIFFVLPGESMDHFKQFVNCWSLATKSGLATIWLATVWHLWHGRNAVIFREENLESVGIFEAVKLKSWSWIKACNKNCPHSLSEWFNEPLACLGDM